MESIIILITLTWLVFNLYHSVFKLRIDYDLLLLHSSETSIRNGFKTYICNDCQTINVLLDNGRPLVGKCCKCDQQLRNYWV